jgi:hypothetical protein
VDVGKTPWKNFLFILGDSCSSFLTLARYHQFVSDLIDNLDQLINEFGPPHKLPLKFFSEFFPDSFDNQVMIHFHFSFVQGKINGLDQNFGNLAIIIYGITFWAFKGIKRLPEEIHQALYGLGLKFLSYPAIYFVGLKFFVGFEF